MTPDEPTGSAVRHSCHERWEPRRACRRAPVGCAEIRATLGNYPALGRAAAARIPRARLVEFPELGHAPRIQAPDAFQMALLDGLRGDGQTTEDRGK
jgi:pimeloyl-ACP methyl ester carboxylesterase